MLLLFLRPHARRLRVHGTIARAEHHEPPRAVDLVMKLARVLPALAHCPALGMVLVGTPVSAADPAEEVATSLNSSRFSSDAAGHLTNEERFDQAVSVAAPRDSKSRSYNIGVAITSTTDLNFELSAGENSLFDVPVELSKARKPSGAGSTVKASSEWSPGIANWSHYEARLFAIDRKHPNFTRGVPLTVLGQRVVVSQFTLGRNRIKLKLSTAF